jgi:hypothetical protein
VVDLSGVTFIDETGQAVLKAMMQEGAQFITCGMCTKYLLDKLGRSLRSDERASFVVSDCEDLSPENP